MVEFKEFTIEQVLTWQPQIEIDPLEIKELKIEHICKYPFYGQSTTNNGIINYLSLDLTVLNNIESKPTILVHSNNQSIVYLETPFYLKDGHGATSVLQSTFLNKKIALYIITAIRKAIEKRFTYNSKATKIALKRTFISLPTSNGKINYEYMESYLNNLEQERLCELETYFKSSELDNSVLTAVEQKAVEQIINSTEGWNTYNVEDLFGKSTRGKRLKSFDRVSGNLPFVTAGETNDGISDYIGNEVQVFFANTSTIDMFGSAKYRDYLYGADDHVAVVHTENLPKYAAMFVTTALHKASHAGQFDYSRNFYAKDADKLYISLPSKNGMPDYEIMVDYMKATQKLVMEDIIKWKDNVIENHNEV